MLRKGAMIPVFGLVGLTTVAVVSAAMRSQSEGRPGMRQCACCAVGMAQPEAIQGLLTQGRKAIGEEFTCPIDGRRTQVTEDTPSTEYRGKTYYFCSEEEKAAFLRAPDRYSTAARAKGE